MSILVARTASKVKHSENSRDVCRHLKPDPRRALLRGETTRRHRFDGKYALAFYLQRTYSMRRDRWSGFEAACVAAFVGDAFHFLIG